MLVLTRKQGQGFLLGDNVEITLLEISGDQVRIAIKAPKELRILRKELAETRTSNREAVLEALPKAGELSELKSLLLQKEGDKKGKTSKE